MKLLSIYRQHGKQFIKDLKSAELPKGFRGMPVISESITTGEADIVARMCPSQAIQTLPFSIDLGRCEFCNECHFSLPEKIIFTNNHRLATNVREQLLVPPGGPYKINVDPEHARKEIRSYFHHALKLRQVSAGGDNATEMELNASGNVNFDMGRYGIEFVASPRHADGIVLTGPVTKNMAFALLDCYQATPAPKLLILAGTAAISGGVFAGSSALDRTFLKSLKPDLYVPGNPPHPLTFILGILALIGK